MALGWNVYRDVLLKPRAKVLFAAVLVGTPGPEFARAHRWLEIRVTNHGPGPLNVTGCQMRIAPLWRRLLRRPELFVLLPDAYQGVRPPQRIDVGETASFYFLPDLLLKPGSHAYRKVTHIGVHDSFGRSHFAPKSDLRGFRETSEGQDLIGVGE
jgi:hypothetical protein